MGEPNWSEVHRRWQARRSIWSEALSNWDLASKSVLDAGTGEGHLTRFLAERHPARLVSITLLPEEIEPARVTVAELADRVEFQIADVTALTAIADDTFDLVVGDFLIAALASYSPFREVEAVRELVRVLRPGGRIVLTGWQVWPTPRNRLESAVRDLARLREAIHVLQGRVPFREHPMSWIVARLGECDCPTERTVRHIDRHFDLSWFIRSVRQAFEGLEPPALQQALSDTMNPLVEQVESADLSGGIEFGQLYAVVACKTRGGILLK